MIKFRLKISILTIFGKNREGFVYICQNTIYVLKKGEFLDED